MTVKSLRFFADSMLGKLARWLRIIGYDTLYDSSISDEEIISRSIKEDRIILTRDTLLVKRRGVSRYLFIESDHIKEVRGKGLFIGVELRVPARRFCEALQDRGILCKETHENVIRFAPPLVITKEEIDWAMTQIEPVLMMD